MNAKEENKVSDSYYVNEATLELLQRRMESNIKTSFFAWVGLPVGGAGILAIVWAVFWWIPTKLNELADQPRIKEKIEMTVDKSVSDYLKGQEGQRFVERQIEAVSRRHILQSVADHFASEAWRSNVSASVALYLNSEAERREMEAMVTAHITSPEASNNIRRLVTDHLDSAPIRDLIRNSINEAVKPKLTAMSQQIEQNKERLVSTVAPLELSGVERFEKGTIPELDKFLRSQAASDLRRSGKPFALTKHIRRGPIYEEGAIGEHLDRIERFFGKQFRFVVIYDVDEKFLAVVSPTAFKSRLNQKLMKLLNARDAELSSENARQSLKDIFGAESTDFVAGMLSVTSALTAPVWKDFNRLDLEIPVVGAEGQFLGMTTRRRLIDGILSSGA